jgi:hypothetical protein
MTCIHSTDMLILTGPGGGPTYVDPAAIQAIGATPGRGEPGDRDYAPELTKLVLPGSIVFVTEPPAVVLVQRQHALGKVVAHGDDPTAWKFLPVQMGAEVGPVNGGAVR